MALIGHLSRCVLRGPGRKKRPTINTKIQTEAILHNDNNSRGVDTACVWWLALFLHLHSSATLSSFPHAFSLIRTLCLFFEINARANVLLELRPVLKFLQLRGLAQLTDPECRKKEAYEKKQPEDTKKFKKREIQSRGVKE
jgi:hypothetical protein